MSDESLNMYNTVCDGRFSSINSDMRDVRDDTQYLRRKIDNGLSSLPGKVDMIEENSRKQIRTIFYGAVLPILVAVIAGAGFWLYSFGKLEQKLSSHIEITEKALIMILEEGTE